MNEEKKQYEVFHIDRPSFITKFLMNPTSKRVVKAVAKVQAYNESLSDISRGKYATEAGLPKIPIKADNGKEIGYEHELLNVYDANTVTAALAEVLFKGCPKLLEVKDEAVKIIDEELFDSIDEGVVNRCFLDFRMQQRGTPLSSHPS